MYWDAETLKKIKNTLDEKINIIQPDIVFVPTYEWGHCVHDLTNLLVYDLKDKYNIFESAEYNGYIWFSTPKKLFYYLLAWAQNWFLTDPLSKFDFQSDFLPTSVQKYSWEEYSISLDKNEKKLKKSWLSSFSTQNLWGSISKKFFNHTIFRKYVWHDYNHPYKISDSLSYKIRKVWSSRKDCEKISVCNINYKDFSQKFLALYGSWN